MPGMHMARSLSLDRANPATHVPGSHSWCPASMRTPKAHPHLPAACGTQAARLCAAATSRTSTTPNPMRGHAGQKSPRQIRDMSATLSPPPRGSRGGPSTRAGQTVTRSHLGCPHVSCIIIYVCVCVVLACMACMTYQTHTTHTMCMVSMAG